MHGLRHLFLFLHHFLNLVSHVINVVSFSLEMSLEFSTSLKTCSKILLELCSLLCCYNNLSSSVFSCNIIAGTFIMCGSEILLSYWQISTGSHLWVGYNLTILGEKIQNSKNQAPSYLMFITGHSLNRSHAPMY